MILTIDDFTSTYVITYLENDPTEAAKYLQMGDDFYSSLLRKFDVNTDYLPAEVDVSNKVRQVLVMHVNCRVSADNIEASIRKINQDVAEDPWLTRKGEWCPMVDEMIKDLISDDFYDPNNPPPEDEITEGNPLVKRWNRV